ncbi:MAG: hypothetical protein IH623_28130 [Verrucomicrobia bacterium]|nr:hypothetical protein [Verrucomicrobiota bacterium]
MVVFEYELPLEDGNRIDVVLLLPNGLVLVIECKDVVRASVTDAAQAAGYAERIVRYHAESHELTVIPLLLVLKATSAPKRPASPATVQIVPGAAEPGLRDILLIYLRRDGQGVNTESWLRSGFKPQPGLVKSFVEAYERSSSALFRVPEDATTTGLLDFIATAVEQVQTEKTHALILVPDEPAKTAIALRALVQQVKRGIDSIYLTGGVFHRTGLRALLNEIDCLDEKKPAASLVRISQAFLRSATRGGEESAAKFYILDSTADTECFDPLKSNDDSLPRQDMRPILASRLRMHVKLPRWATTRHFHPRLDLPSRLTTHSRWLRRWTRCQRLVLDAVARKEWGLALVFVKKAQRELDLWVYSVAARNQHKGTWTVFTPIAPRFPLAPEAMTRLVIKPNLEINADELAWEPEESRERQLIRSNQEKWLETRNGYFGGLPQEIRRMDVIPEEYITKDMITGRKPSSRVPWWQVTLCKARFGRVPAEHLTFGRTPAEPLTCAARLKPLMEEAARTGHLKDMPQHLLSWDAIVCGVEEDPSLTPLRHAAKYGYLDQVPAAACAEHFEQAKAIVIDAAERSRNARWDERQIAVRRWLIKVILYRTDNNRVLLAQAKDEVEAFARDAVQGNWVVRVGPTLSNPSHRDTLNAEDTVMYWLRRYVETRVEDYLDLALMDGYLAELFGSFADGDETISVTKSKA